jgi:hypothetical protein
MATSRNGRGSRTEPGWEETASQEPPILSPAQQAERASRAAQQSDALDLAGKDPSLASPDDPLRMPGELSAPTAPHEGSPPTATGTARHEEIIWRAVRASNAAWLAGRAQDAGRLLHPEVVVVAPDLQRTVVGREAVVASFAAFVKQAKVHRFEEREHAVTLLPPHAGGGAVVTYRFSIRYEMNGAIHDEQGQEILLLIASTQGWQVVWRTQIPLPG